MPDFIVKDDTIEKIALQYGVRKDTVGHTYTFYKELSVGIRRQYLAHIIRAMEEELRHVSENQFFVIKLYPVNAGSKELGIASAQYFKNRYFSIYYHPNTDEKQLRILLAHELGHLFLIEWLNNMRQDQDKEYNEKDITEPVSTIFGIFATLDKDDFYHRRMYDYRHNTQEEVLADFEFLIKNRSTCKLDPSS